MVNDSETTQTWLTLKQAAAQLGIHPTTLRRWADHNEISHILTPGGHRRFAVDDIKAFAASRRQMRKTMPAAKAWAEGAVSRTRQDIAEQQQSAWLTNFDDEGRAHQRMLGQQILGLSLQYIAEPDPHILAQAHELGHEYGRICRHVNISLTDTLKAMLFFRDRMVETALQLPEKTRIKPEANVRLLRRINKLLNTIQLAIVEIYDDTHTHSLPRA